MMGGVLIYVVPYYRLTADICKILSDNYEHLGVWRFTDKEFARFRQVDFSRFDIDDLRVAARYCDECDRMNYRLNGIVENLARVPAMACGNRAFC